MKLAKLRDLHFSAASGGGWLSAASGLVRDGSRLYVIADDPSRPAELFRAKLPTPSPVGSSALR